MDEILAYLRQKVEDSRYSDGSEYCEGYFACAQEDLRRVSEIVNKQKERVA